MITFGDIKLDTFVVLDDKIEGCELKMPECKLCIDFGAKIDVGDVDSQMAGSAPNVAIGLARLKRSTAIVSWMGEDGTKALAHKRLEEEGVATRFIQTTKGQQSSYSVVLNFKGERTILTSHIKQRYKIPAQLSKTKWFYVCEMGDDYETLYKTIGKYVREKKGLLAINPGSRQIEERKPVLFMLIKNSDLLFVNLEEAQAITGETTKEVHHLIKALWDLGPKQVVMTDGGNGAYGFDGEELYHVPIFPAKLKEMTGSGDAFATGYIGALMDGLNVPGALMWGAVNAASVVESVGPQAGLLSKTQIQKRLRERKSYKAKQL